MIPKDQIMLMSYLNTQLRDNYSSLDDLCASLGIEKDEIEMKLKKAGYYYSKECNKFMNK